jgi:hypothetical protein
VNAGAGHRSGPALPKLDLTYLQEISSMSTSSRKVQGTTVIGTAVAAALWGSQALAAVPYGPYDLTLVVSGSSAFRDQFRAELGAGVCGGLANVYDFRASGTGAPDMRAYACHTPATGTPVPNKDILVYYRSELGSITGYAPIQNAKQIKRLVVSNTVCPASPTIGTSNACTVTGWDVNHDTCASGCAADTVQLGVADLEPGILTGFGAPVAENGNYPVDASIVAFLGADPNGATGNLGSVNGISDQVFTFIANSKLGVTNLNKQTLASIFNGTYGDWSVVPKADGSGFVTTTSVPIIVCERDQGSGTRASHTVYLGLNKQCGSAPLAIAATTSAFCNAVSHECASTGTEISCVASSTQTGAIGYAVNQGAVAPAGTTYIAVDGKLPNLGATSAPNIVAASGGYDYWYQATMNYSKALQTNTTGLKTLADCLVHRLNDSANLPASSASLMADPAGAVSFPAIPVADPTKPVNVATRPNGSCSSPVNQN